MIANLRVLLYRDIIWTKSWKTRIHHPQEKGGEIILGRKQVKKKKKRLTDSKAQKEITEAGPCKESVE